MALQVWCSGTYRAMVID